MSLPSILHDLRGLAGKSVIYGAGSIMLRALSFLLLPVYTRFLSPVDYGITGATSSVIGVLSILLPFGLHGALTRFWFDTDDAESRKQKSGTIFVIMAVFALGVTVVLDLFGRKLFLPLFPTIPFDPYLRLAIWTAFFNTLALIPLVLFQVRERAVQYVLTSAGAAVTAIAFTLWLVVGQRLGAYGFLLGQFLGGAMFVLPSLWIVIRQVRFTLDRGVAVAALLFALPLVPHGLASWVLDLSDRAILAHFVPLADLGIYSVGYQLGAGMGLVVMAFGNAWAPFLFKTIRTGGTATHGRLSSLASYYAMFLCFSGLGLSLLAKPLIALMTSSAFHSAHIVTPWVVWGYVFSGLYIVPVNFLFWRSQTKMVPLLTVGAGLINVALNLCLVPRFGIIAAAAATLVSYMFMLLFAWIAAQREYPFPYEYARIAGAIVLALSLLGLGMLTPAGGFKETAGRLLCWMLYPVSLVVFRVIRPVEVASLRSIMATAAGRGAAGTGAG